MGCATPRKKRKNTHASDTDGEGESESEGEGWEAAARTRGQQGLRARGRERSRAPQQDDGARANQCGFYVSVWTGASLRMDDARGGDGMAEEWGGVGPTNLHSTSRPTRSRTRTLALI